MANFTFPNYGLFNSTYYLQQNPDVATSWTGTPLQHYIQFGALEGRAPTAWFNADFYRASYTDLQSMNALQLFNHYCNNGFNEGRVPMLNFSNFNGARYLLDNPDVAAAGYTAGNAISHYVAYGEYEGRAAYATNGVVIDPVVNEGDLYTLTTGVDNIDGTQFNDTFDASQTNTLQNFDSLDGMGGTDTLYATINSNVTPAQLANMEVISATATGAATLNLINGGQVTNVNNNASTSALVVTNIAAGADLLVSNVVGVDTQFDYANVTGTQSADLTVDGVSAGLAVPEISVEGVETINITASGNDSEFRLVDTAANTLNIAGNANLTVDLTATTGAVSLINASTLTGDLDITTGAQAAVPATTDITVTAGLGDDVIDVTGLTQDYVVTMGAGDDVLVTGGTLSTGDTVVGGLGFDTLAATSAELVAPQAYTNISLIDNIEVQGNLGGDLTLSQIQAGITNVTLLGTANARTITFDSGVSGTVEMNVAQAAAPNGALTVVSAGTGTTDSLTIVNGSAAANVLNGNALTATGVETLNLNLGTTTATAQAVGAINATSGTTAVVFSGNNGVTTGVITAGSINASGLTGAAALTQVGQAVGVTSIIGSANADTLVGSATATTILAGAGNDTATGGVAADSIDGGTGNDSLVGAGGNDTIHGGEGNDTIEATVAGTVSITGGVGDDLVNMGATISANDTIDGGAGANTLAISAQTIAAYAGATNFQTLRLNTGVTTQNVALFTGTAVSEVELNQAAAFTVSGLADGTVLSALTGSSVTATHATDTASNTLTIAGLDLTAPLGAVTLAAVTANDTNTLNITGGDVPAASALTVQALNAIEAATINISGVQATSVTVGASAAATGLGTVAHAVAINASAATGTVVFDGTTALATQALTITGSVTAANTLTGGAGNDVITGGAASDSLVGNGGADTIDAGTGAVTDTVTGGTGADTVTLNVDGAIDRVNFVSGDSVASTSNTLSANITAGDTITFTNGIDVVNNFLAGATNGDVLADGNGATAPTSLINFVSANNMVAGTTYFLSGAYNSLTGTFTIAANGTGADTLIVDGTATTVAATTGAVVLVGVDSDNLVAANFA